MLDFCAVQVKNAGSDIGKGLPNLPNLSGNPAEKAANKVCPDSLRVSTYIIPGVPDPCGCRILKSQLLNALIAQSLTLAWEGSNG